ncbi:MAG: LUD domain-containing protein, partial [Bacteroidetes bacterium]|nr:LUD domain-containing protein [Bacteroidota bacterium]
MSVSSSKEAILKKIRKALSTSTPLPFPQSEGNNSLYQPSQQELELQFAEVFSGLQGKFAFCLDYTELAAQLNALLKDRGWTKIYCLETALQEKLAAAGFNTIGGTTLTDCDASITTCEHLVARTGTIVMTAASRSGRTTSVYAPVHICVAHTSQLVYDVKDALHSVKEKYAGSLPSLITFASGPSRTADIEKTLVVGV